jgi:hypothetical protein
VSGNGRLAGAPAANGVCVAAETRREILLAPSEIGERGLEVYTVHSHSIYVKYGFGLLICPYFADLFLDRCAWVSYPPVIPTANTPECIMFHFIVVMESALMARTNVHYHAVSAEAARDAVVEYWLKMGETAAQCISVRHAA